MNPILVADIGGTNARFALFDITEKKVSKIQKVTIDSDVSFLTLVTHYLDQLPIKITHACIAIACPVEGDKIAMTNNHLAFSRKQLQAELGLTQLEVINDFTAVAHCVPALGSQDVVQIGGESPAANHPIAIYGPGTGLGVNHLLNINNQWISLSGEGGHTELPMINADEDHVLAQLRIKFGRVSAERFLSGQGIVNIYQALCNIHQNADISLTPDVIVNRALANECPLCLQTLTLFCTFMGRFGGNLALTLNTQAGVYIAGGIVPRFVDFFKQSPFRANFEQKGRMSYLLKRIPVYIITHDDPGLLGAGMYIQQKLVN